MKRGRSRSKVAVSDLNRSSQPTTSTEPHPNTPANPARQWLPRRLLAVAVIALAAWGGYAILAYCILTRVPPALVGTWVVVEVRTKDDSKADEALKGGRLQFRRDGVMIGKVNLNGKEAVITAKAVVEGQTLKITSVNPHTGQSVTDVQTIRTLAGDHFVIEDRKGTVLVLERLRD
jgi:hypothetical protein